MKRVKVIGVGLGNTQLLSGYAVKCIKEAELVIATERLHQSLRQMNPNSMMLPFSQITTAVLESGCEQIAVAVSGDVGFYSISSILQKKLRGYALEFINGISSLQYLAAKLQTDYAGIQTVSVHGRENAVIPHVCYNERVFVLTGGKQKAHHVLNALTDAGLGQVLVTVAENLSYETESIQTDMAKNLCTQRFGDLAVMLIEHKNHAKAYEILQDADFIRGNVPMTKAEVRQLSIAKLGLTPTDTVYDIGAGTGSVAIAMCRLARESFVYAIEKQDEALRLLAKNRAKHGAYNMVIISGNAPDALSELPPPNKVFIGGSSGNLRVILQALLEKTPALRVVINAVTLETLQEAVACLKQYGFGYEVLCVNISKAEPTGNYHMMKAQNPVYIISGEKTNGTERNL